jgi:hypothetical protein
MLFPLINIIFIYQEKYGFGTFIRPLASISGFLAILARISGFSGIYIRLGRHVYPV